MRFFVFAFLILLIGCSDDAPKNPLACTSVPEGLTLSTETYTGDTYSIKGTGFCNDITAVMVNDVEVNISLLTATEITFVVPAITKDSATLKLKTAGGILDLKHKIAVYPGNGTWREVLSFPGEGRSNLAYTVMDGKGYIIGGDRRIDSDNYKRYQELYQYDPLVNNWSLVANNNFFNNSIGFNASSLSGVIFLIGSNSDLASSYIFSSNTGSLLPSPKSMGISSAVTFTIKNFLYVSLVDFTNSKISIQKYDVITKKWNEVQSLPYTGTINPDLGSAFESNGKILITYSFVGSKDYNLWAFDPVINSFEKQSVYTLPASVGLGSPILRYLFTIGDLAYFSEGASVFASTTQVVVRQPAPYLFTYNLKSKTWRMLSHTYPDSFTNVAAFAINNRGFAGMGISSTGTTFVYTQKFYEFAPK